MRYAALLLLLLLVRPHPAHALRYTALQMGKLRVLYIHDCHDGEREPCREYEREFSEPDPEENYSGDAETFRRVLATHTFDKVLLNSDGGAVYEAIQMAQTLRAAHIPVFVPEKAHCVSSCTVMFMGGYLRTIDPTATYEVHSASSFQGGVEWKTHRITNEGIEPIAENPEEELRSFARVEQKNARFLASAFLRIFQNTLLIPTGKPPIDEDLGRLRLEAGIGLPPLPYGQENNSERLADIRRIHAEGRAAVQDIMMRLERELMTDAIHELEQRPDLGPRSEPALEMERLMYMESIRETSTLSPSELLRRGYVTPKME